MGPENKGPWDPLPSKFFQVVLAIIVSIAVSEIPHSCPHYAQYREFAIL